MLADFIDKNRGAIIAGAQDRVATRQAPKPTEIELTDGIPVFLDQLSTALRIAASSDVVDHDAISQSAGRHGQDLQKLGLTVGQVVHDYGDVCQAITELAIVQKAPIAGDEFQTLNLCLDDAIAGAVAGYARDREMALSEEGTERLGFLAHELRNLLNTATLTFESIKSGRVTAAGSTGLVLSRSLIGMRDLIDRTLAEVRLEAGLALHAVIPVSQFVGEVEIGAMLQAQSYGVVFVAEPVADRAVAIGGDLQLLAAALSNLLHNAFKYSRKSGRVSLTTRVVGGRVLFEIQDECGGLPPGKTDDLFRAFEQRDHDRSGVGLGLSVSLKAAKSGGGTITVRDLPGKGCVFTLDLPVATGE